MRELQRAGLLGDSTLEQPALAIPISDPLELNALPLPDLAPPAAPMQKEQGSERAEIPLRRSGRRKGESATYPTTCVATAAADPPPTVREPDALVQVSNGIAEATAKPDVPGNSITPVSSSLFCIMVG